MKESDTQNQEQQKHFLNLKCELITVETIETIVNNLYTKINQNRQLYFIPTPAKSSPDIIPAFRVNNIEHYRRALSHKSFIIEQNILVDRGILDLYRKVLVPETTTPELVRQIKELDSTFDLEHFRQFVSTGNSTLNYIPKQSYERYEFLGDSILKTVQGEYIFHRYPGRSGKATESERAKKISENNEEFMTVLRTKIEKTDQLAKFTKFLGLERYILISSHIENLNYNGQGRENPSLLEDVFEAMIGAIVQDRNPSGGFEEVGKRYSYAYNFVVGVMEQTVNFSELVLRNDNFKDSLLKYIAQNNWELANRQGKKSPFEEIYTSGPSNNRRFIVGVFIPSTYISKDRNDKVNSYKNKMIQQFLKSPEARNSYNQIVKQTGYILVGLGMGNSKKSAEQKASNKALWILGIPLNY